MKKNLMLLTAGIFTLTLFAFTAKTSDQKPWPVPAEFKNKANPVKSDAASLAKGKDLFTQHCKSCHGAKGKGDGPKSAQLETECGDFTKAAFQAETDGSIFYKVEEGRKDMPSFKKKIADANDVWAVVNYLRTLK